MYTAVENSANLLKAHKHINNQHCYYAQKYSNLNTVEVVPKRPLSMAEHAKSVRMNRRWPASSELSISLRSPASDGTKLPSHAISSSSIDRTLSCRFSSSAAETYNTHNYLVFIILIQSSKLKFLVMITAIKLHTNCGFSLNLHICKTSVARLWVPWVCPTAASINFMRKLVSQGKIHLQQPSSDNYTMATDK